MKFNIITFKFRDCNILLHYNIITIIVRDSNITFYYIS